MKTKKTSFSAKSSEKSMKNGKKEPVFTRKYSDFTRRNTHDTDESDFIDISNETKTHEKPQRKRVKNSKKKTHKRDRITQNQKWKPGDNNKKFQEEMILKIYHLAKESLSDPQIAQALQISEFCLRRWQKIHPGVRDALTQARQGKSSLKAGETLREFIFNSLPPRLQELWRKINRFDKKEGGSLLKENLFKSESKEVRQHLFLYALICNSFNPSEACRLTHTPYSTLRKWKDDPDFEELLQEIEWHKGNFFETALIGLVKKGDVGSILMVNRSFNKERGYGEKVKVDVDIKGQIEHLVVDIDKLNLPLETRRQILEAMRGEEPKLIENKEVATPLAIEQKESV